MINIQKHIISEAFEQLAKKNKLKESIQIHRMKIYNCNQRKRDDIKVLCDPNVEFKLIDGPLGSDYCILELTGDNRDLRSIEDDLRSLRYLSSALGTVDVNYPEDTATADWEDTNDVKFDESVKKTPILYVIKDKHGNQLSAPNPDDSELWDRVESMQQRGRQGLKVVVYVPDKQVVDESVKYPNGELVTDIDLDSYLDYYYGEDRDKDNNNYSVREKQRATDYWFKKHDTPFNESKLIEDYYDEYKMLINRINSATSKADLVDIDRLINKSKYADDARKGVDDSNNYQSLQQSLYRKSKEIIESKLTEAPLTPAEYAAKARARKTSNPLQKINSQLNPDMSVTDQLQVYFDELVPSSGKAKTVAGEIIRAIMRLMYRDYNDGDLWYTGYGKETCGSEVIYLINVLPDFAYDYFSHMAENGMEYAEYTDALEELAENIIVYLNENPQLFTQENTDDSRRHDYNELDNIFTLPTYEFDVDASYDDSQYDVSDDDIDQFIHDIVESDFRGATVNRWASDGWTIEDLDKEQLEYLEDIWERWFRDFLSQYEREYDEEEFDESLDKDNQKRGKDMNTVAEDFELSNLDKMGTNEYEANKNRDKHIKMYRKFANITDSEPITEETINEYALNKTATYCNREPERIKAEILGQRYSEYEQE